MADRVERSGLKVDAGLAEFIEDEVLAPLGLGAADFWQGFAALLERLVPVNRSLLAKRDMLQEQIDAWHIARAGKVLDPAEYRALLTEIGYLVPAPAPFTVTTQNVDAEIATMAGPQLVVPVLNARFLLNAANARWGSLYDAYYGTDALGFDFEILALWQQVADFLKEFPVGRGVVGLARPGAVPRINFPLQFVTPGEQLAEARSEFRDQALERRPKGGGRDAGAGGGALLDKVAQHGRDLQAANGNPGGGGHERAGCDLSGRCSIPHSRCWCLPGACGK